METDIFDWVLSQNSKSEVPERVCEEIRCLIRTKVKGPALRQADEFKKMLEYNRHAAHTVSKRMMDLGVVMGDKGPTFCYCCQPLIMDDLTDDLVECAHLECPMNFFHKDCIADLGFEEGHKWYCLECFQEMGLLACEILHGTAYSEIGSEEEIEDESQEA